jgi:IMP dehydrogenase/GMP reductase
MILDKVGYNYSDLTIIPARNSNIKSRSECNCLTEAGKLPIITAPMSCVCNEVNYKLFNKYFYTIIPRNIPISTRMEMLINDEAIIALSLKEFEDFINEAGIYNKSANYRICIDIANGHMFKMLNLVRKAKEEYFNLYIISGNIANPEVLFDYEGFGIDAVRIGIGSGNCCITSSNTGIHYPVASLLNECRRIKDEHNFNISLIADGGIQNYDDIIKSLALGADYVMLGSLLGSLFESAASFNNLHEITNLSDTDFSLLTSDYYLLTEKHKRELLHRYGLTKSIYGMASRTAQEEISNKSCKTSEGIHKNIEVKYTIEQWIENMSDYLRSAMSYCNCTTLQEFIGNQTLIPNYSRGFNK